MFQHPQLYAITIIQYYKIPLLILIDIIINQTVPEFDNLITTTVSLFHLIVNLILDFLLLTYHVGKTSGFEFHSSIMQNIVINLFFLIQEFQGFI